MKWLIQNLRQYLVWLVLWRSQYNCSNRIRIATVYGVLCDWQVMCFIYLYKCVTIKKAYYIYIYIYITTWFFHLQRKYYTALTKYSYLFKCLHSIPYLYTISFQPIMFIKHCLIFIWRFSLFLSLSIFRAQCIWVWFWIYPTQSRASWTCRLMYFIKFEKFSTIVSLSIFFFSFLCLLAFWYSHYTHVTVLPGLRHFSKCHSSFFLSVF